MTNGGSPVRIVPFTLYDIKPFIEREHPVYLPNTEEYNRYWGDTILGRCINGLWGLDNDDRNLGGYRWMPGNLYFYINFTKILQERDGEPEVTDYPLLRDLDWLIMYALNTCDGFSGFEGDDEYTSFHVVDKVERGEKVTFLEKKLLNKYSEYVKKKDGSFKKYIDPRQYLYKTHDKPMGNPLYLNPCTNFMLISTRACGKSYTMNGDTTHAFVFNGARSVYDYYQGAPSTTVVVGSGDSSKSAEFLDKFIKNYDIIKTSCGAYGSGDIVIHGAYWMPTEGSLELNKRLKKRVRSKGGKGFIGNDTKIVHVSFAANPSAGVSYRARRIVCEEAGLIPRIQKVHSENEGSQMRETKIGFTSYIGTGGLIDKTRELKEMFFSPRAYKILPYEDIFTNSGKEIGLFIPSYYRKNAYRDENGNTNIEEAFADEMADLDAIKAGSSKAYHNYRISFPILPQDMFMTSVGGVFPTQMLEDRLAELDLEFKYSVGSLSYTNMSNTECSWKEDVGKKLNPYLSITDINDSTRTSREGAIVVYEHPMYHKPDRHVVNPMYLVVYDPVEAEDGDGSSLCAVLVFKFWDLDRPDSMQFNVVAEWIGRHDRLEKNHEVAYKLAAYYGCKILPEVNKPDIKRYARMTNRYHWLEEKPALALDGIVKSKSDYDVGYKVLPGMKADFEVYANELLLTVISTSERIEGDTHIVDNEYAARYISSKLGIEMLLSYDRDVNNDWTSALFGVGLWVRQKKLKPIKYEAVAEAQKESDVLKKILSSNPKQKHTQIVGFNY